MTEPRQIARDDLSAADFEGLRALAGKKRIWPLVKRGVDITVSAMMLAMLSPFLMVVAVLVRAGSPGPILYRSSRHGRNGRPFMMLKFRSMVVAREVDDLAFKQRVSHAGVLAKSASDPRVTPIGRWMRRTSVDELPQLINVLSGDMSLVGPRPVMPEMLAPFPMFNRARTLVRPGLSGLWQVRDRSNATHVAFMWRHDLEYLERMSFSLDLWILSRTALAVLRRTGS